MSNDGAGRLGLTGPSGRRADETRTARRAPGKNTRTQTLAMATLQRALSDAGAGDIPTVGAVATAAVNGKGSGEPVAPSLRRKVESRLRVDLSAARVHSDPLANEASSAMGARAFAHDRDIFLGGGESSDDVELMAHELTHVVQQGAARPAVQRQLEVGEANSPAEAEADQVAAAVASNENAAVVVDDQAAPQSGQMSKSDFLARVEAAVTAAADETLGPVWSALGCPYITRYIAYYQGKDAAHVERAARRYSRAATSVASAAELIPLLVARVRAGVAIWRDTGELPADAAALAPSDAPSAPVPAAPDSAADVQAKLGEGAAVDPRLANAAGEVYGDDFGDVRVHTGSSAAQLAREHQAMAFTVGTDIVMRQGAYQPGTVHGDALLAHELAHVSQQRGGDETARRKQLEEGDEHGEEGADQAATSLLARLYGGAKGAVKGIADRVSLARDQGFKLQRCKDPAPVGPPPRVYADAFIQGLHTKLTAADKAGFFADLGGLGGSRAADAAVRSAFGDFQSDGLINWTEAFRAAVLLELGPRHGWPQLIQNYDDGLTSGQFTVANLPPTGAEALRQFCMVQAGNAAEGAGNVAASYRNQFNSKWDDPAFAALASTLDPTLDSKGPRNQRARAIFTALYTDAAIRTAYDTNTPARFRDLCDTHQAPDGINLIASPRLQTLRALFNPPAVVATGTADAAYIALTAAITPAVHALDGADRQEIARNHTWRLAVDEKVTGSTPPITATLRAALWGLVQHSRPVAPPVVAPPVVPVAPEPAPTLGPPERAWLSGISLAAPPSPVQANAAQHDLAFTITSAVANPGVGVRRHVTVEPAAQVISGQDDQTTWPAASSSVPHTATVDPDAGAAPSRVFTARLNMPPVPTAEFAEKTAAVTVEDKRQDWFRTNIGAGATFMDENQSTGLTAGSTVHYFGGQLPITLRPGLPAPNPGLDIQMDGTIKRSGAAVKTFARMPFGRTATSDQLGFHIVPEPGAPPPTEPMEVEVKFYSGPAPAALQTRTIAFNVAPSRVLGVGADAAILTADTATLNQPPAVAGSLLNHMTTAFGPTTPEHRVALGVASGAIQVEAVIVRSDSATWLAANGHNPLTQVAYACGNMTNARQLVAAPGAIGWRWGAFPNHVFLNLTPQINHPGSKRGNASMAGLLAHEGIHAADRAEPGALGRYTTEFRAYWIMGTGAGLSTAPDPTMTGMGPKSPRARNIFRHLYDHPLYSSFTRPNYDNNVDNFREQVDNMLVPDGVNLALSGTLQSLRSEVESFTGAGFAAKRTLIQTRYAACTPADKQEITNNRAWRDLVEDKFTVAAERNHIKTDLAIPR